MNQQLTLSSPNPNVAQKTVVAITHASTRIKEAIVRSFTLNIPQDELTKELNKIIAEVLKKFDDDPLKEEMRKALVISARKWHYEISETFKILNTNLVNDAKRFNFNLGTLTIDVFNSGKIIEEFRPYLDKNAKGLAIIKDYETKVEGALKALSAEPPKIVSVKRKDGVEYTYTMSARNRAEIAARYEANLKDLQDLIKKGVKYVWTTSHPNCSPRCQPHQGKLYSLDPDDRYGVINGHSYTYLGDVLVLNEGNSIINGYNCRHRLVEYVEGSIAPDEYTEEEIKAEYQIDSRQRQYENTIRQLKTEEQLLRAYGNDKKASLLRKRWRRLQKRYEIFSLQNERPIYRWRTEVISSDM